MTAFAVLAPSCSPSSVRDYIALLKPGVMSLVVFTGAVGMWLAPGHLHPFLQFITLLCIAIGSGASGAINMWYDRDIDCVMRRTQRRPIPQGRIAPEEALSFGIILALASVVMLGLAVNWMAAGFLAGAIFFYVFIYTMWLKRRTPQNIVIGGAAGAFPPVIGWAAVTGQVDPEPWILFAITFFWTPPHFWALALYRCGDYTKAGVPMLPVVAGLRATKVQMVGYTLLLAAVTLLPFLTGMSGLFYLLVAMLLNAVFVYYALRVRFSEGDILPRKMFFFSLLYLFLLYATLIADRLFS
ncbi:MAG: protoheme IX farnesyltransferase [Alphaproteobacteria bacterium]|nr:protoheme IX farnesyltransferase [Alphaproteobacteria bacterium]